MLPPPAIGSGEIGAAAKALGPPPPRLIIATRIASSNAAFK